MEGSEACDNTIAVTDTAMERSFLLELPTELRLRIFNYIFSDVRAVVQSTSKSQLLLTIPKTIHTGIFQCSKLLKAEAETSFYDNLVFHYQAEALAGMYAGTLWSDDNAIWTRLAEIKPHLQRVVLTIDSSKSPSGGPFTTVFTRFADDFKVYRSLRQCTIRDVQVCSINNVLQHKRVSASEYERMSEEQRVKYFKEGGGSDPAAVQVGPNGEKPEYYTKWNDIKEFLEHEWNKWWGLDLNLWLRRPELQTLAANGKTLQFYLELESRIIFWPYWAPVHIESQVSEIDSVNCELLGTRIASEDEKKFRIEERAFSAKQFLSQRSIQRQHRQPMQ